MCARTIITLPCLNLNNRIPAIVPRLHPLRLEEQAIRGLTTAYQRMRQEISKVIIGQDEVVDQLLIAMFCRGHCLLVGVPGLAKTLLCSTIAGILQLSFRRIQFTPDLMPSDITGTDVLQDDPETGRRVFQFIPGPLFTNVLLADEINRTPPKTQAALLEAMQERHCTVGSHTYDLPDPFSPWQLRTQLSRKARIRFRKPNLTDSCLTSWSSIRQLLRNCES